MLGRRAGPHSTGSTSNHIAWTCNNFYFAPLMQTLGILALGHVDAQGAPGTVNSREVSCLTGKTYKPIFLDLRHSRLRRGPNNKDNQANLAINRNKVLQIKFPISWITHSNLTDDLSVVISTNRGTIGPSTVLAWWFLHWNRIRRCDAQTTFNWFVHSIDWFSLREQL